ncbi:MAG: diaminopimelate decarboxylase [bacterium]
MALPITAKINVKRHLEVGGCDIVELAKKYGTPLYVLDEETIREKCREYKHFLNKYYPDSQVLYASKALSVVAVMKIMAEMDMGVDITSGGELFTAMVAGVDPAKIYFHGNNKSEAEIAESLRANIGRFVVDSFAEIEFLSKIVVAHGKTANVMIRVLPGIEAHTHEFIQTGKLDSKFGIPISLVPKAVRRITELPGLKFMGIHAHIGSQILKVKPFVVLAEKLGDLAKEIKKKTGQDIVELNLGGGLGIHYSNGDEPPKIESLAKAIATAVKEKFPKNPPKLLIEPGRAFLSQAGLTL